MSKSLPNLYIFVLYSDIALNRACPILEEENAFRVNESYNAAHSSNPSNQEAINQEKSTSMPLEHGMNRRFPESETGCSPQGVGFRNAILVVTALIRYKGISINTLPNKR